MSDIKQFCEEVTGELKEMERKGMTVPDRAFALAADEDEMQDLTDMGRSDCADLLVSLAKLN